MSGGDAPARRSRGATFAGFTEKLREKISASPQPLVLGDPSVRSELAKEHQPETVELDKGEFFENVSLGKQVVQLKMSKAGIAVIDATTKAQVGETFQWQYIADFRVGKNKKTFAIMHDAKKDGSKLERVEWKSADTMRMLGTATKFVDVLAAEMREQAQKDAEAAQRAAEAPAPKKKKADKKAAKKSGLGQHSHSPRGEGADDAAADKDAADKDADADADAAAEKKPRRKRGNTKKKSDEDGEAKKDDDDAAEPKKADADDDDEKNDDNENDANAPAAAADGEAKPRRARRGTKSKGTAVDGAEAAEPLIEKKKKARSRAQTTM